MSFKIEWSLKSESVAIAELSRMTGTGQEAVKQMYRAGALGPDPDVAAQVAQIPLYHAASLFALVDSAKQKIVSDHARP